MTIASRRTGAYTGRSVVVDKNLKREIKELRAYTHQALDSHVRFWKLRGWTIASTRNVIQTDHGDAFQQYMAMYI